MWSIHTDSLIFCIHSQVEQQCELFHWVHFWYIKNFAASRQLVSELTRWRRNKLLVGCQVSCLWVDKLNRGGAHQPALVEQSRGWFRSLSHSKAAWPHPKTFGLRWAESWAQTGVLKSDFKISLHHSHTRIKRFSSPKFHTRLKNNEAFHTTGDLFTSCQKRQRAASLALSWDFMEKHPSIHYLSSLILCRDERWGPLWIERTYRRHSHSQLWAT